MDQRIKIGLLFSYDENWIGGSYYIMNLIASLQLLPDESKPQLIILSKEKEDFDKIKEINYPFIKYLVYKDYHNIVIKGINKLARIFFSKKDWIKKTRINIDVLFPSKGDLSIGKISKHLYWIPDFQELHLPHFFPNTNLEVRKENRKKFANTNNHIVFSSFDALNDYQHFFPDNKTKNEVLNFAVHHPNFNDLNENILEKYNLKKENYFFSPNQFWKHKNHTVILKALSQLKTQGQLDFKVAFSGKEDDYRNPAYFKELKEYVAQNNLNKEVQFLGFIDRKEQLYLMQNALAIIQPSLFEGWSTVVEDAKRINQHCIVSNLKVHQEQLGDKGYYFTPTDENELAALMCQFTKIKIAKPDFNYQENSKFFGINFLKIINRIIATT
jgi:glycosyltransferase involved in cell wall biosynthesis